MTLASIFARRSFCWRSISAMALMISPLKLSRVVSLILPDSYSLSSACFFFLAMSYSSFRRLNECFHEINFKTPSSVWAWDKR